MIRPRWRKLLGDLRTAWGRLLIAELAIAVALAGVGAVLGARCVLEREIAASYLATRPADATLELPGGVNSDLLAELRARPEIADADARQMLHARVKVSHDDAWQPLVLFVAADLGTLRLNTVRPDAGAWPPPAGALLLERTAPAVMGVAPGAALIVQAPHGAPQTIAFAGTVHDAGQAPSWQERRGCAYAALDTLRLLGEPAVLHELLVRFRPEPATMQDVERAAAALATWLRGRGHIVHEVRVPTLRQHPHQGIMNASQRALLVFSLLLLLLSAIVVATVISALLARQTREIGVMKALGATTGQLAAIYVALLVALGAVATAVAVPLASLGAHAMIDKLASLMNLALADPEIPRWVFAAVAALGVVAPVVVAGVPIARAARLPVRRALAYHGGGAEFVRPGLGRLPIAIRSALRRPARLALTLVLLVVSGALVMTAANVQRGLLQISARLAATRLDDLELRLHEPVAAARVASLAQLPGVRAFEAWSASPAALGRAGRELDIVHTYPDGGHGSFALVAMPPAGSRLVALTLREGRWLAPDDDQAIVLGSGAARGARVGDRVTTTVDGIRTSWTVVGIVEELGAGSGFVAPAAFQRATGGDGVRVLRFATTATSDAERHAILAAIEAALDAQQLAVEHAMPLRTMRAVIDGHVLLVVRAVIALAVLLGLVGLVGLGSAIAVGVVERTRELGILKAIGASDARIARIVLGEAAFVSAASALLAIAVALVLTAHASASIVLIAPLPFTISYGVLAGWPPLAIAGSMVASAAPAWRAARMSVRTGLGHV